MTRGRWVAAGVGLVVLAAGIASWDSIWRKITHSHEYSRVVGIARVDPEVPGEEPAYMVVLRKRFEWVSGPGSVALCSWCVADEHGRCPRHLGLILCEEPDGETQFWFTFEPGHTCTCRHRSHDRLPGR